MHRITFHCKLISPLFLAGAKPEKRSELRSTSFKGALAFWWRAMKAYPNTSLLLQEENDIFGGIADKAQKSKVKLRLKWAVENPLSDSAQNLSSESEAIQYLWYSLRRKSRKGFEAGTSFQIRLSFDSRLQK
ncbi:MAG: type III-B CRISPR module RAMP protein Cmr1, partial [Bacteroidota bacterium]